MQKPVESVNLENARAHLLEVWDAFGDDSPEERVAYAAYLDALGEYYAAMEELEDIKSAIVRMV